MRYFIVFYRFMMPDEYLANNFGHISFSVAGFPNRQKLMSEIEANTIENAKIVITNILEISKQDFATWNGKPE